MSETTLPELPESKAVSTPESRLVEQLQAALKRERMLMKMHQDLKDEDMATWHLGHICGLTEALRLVWEVL